MHRSHYDYHSEPSSSHLNNRRSRLNVDDYDDYRCNRSNQSSQSPIRDESFLNDIDFYDPDTTLRLKWMDHSPRMSRIRENRQKRLINKLEQFELWDIEQEQKQKQYELAREQRYKNIMERLKSQDFCVNLMKRRHESDLETTKELETYSNDHIYFDALDDPKTHYKGPVSQYRRFQAEMDDKLKHLQNDLDTLNPRNKIEQAILPRIERTRELYSVEPEVFTRRGKRVLKKPNLAQVKYGSETEKLMDKLEASFRDSERRIRNLLIDSERPKLKPIIHVDDTTGKFGKMKLRDNTTERKVNFNDEVHYGSK